MTDKNSIKLNELYTKVLDKLLEQGTPVKIDAPYPLIQGIYENLLTRNNLQYGLSVRDAIIETFDILRLNNIELYKMGERNKKGELLTKMIILNEVVINSGLDSEIFKSYNLEYFTLSYYKTPNDMIATSSTKMTEGLLHRLETKKCMKHINKRFNPNDKDKLSRLAYILLVK